MAFGKLWVIAYRDLWRNPRRSLASMIAVALGLALLIILSGYVAGVFDEVLQNDIRLRTGHVQMRAVSYEEEKVSLQWEDLLDDPAGVTAQAQALPQVAAAAPVLWANVILNTIDDSSGVRLYGIDVTSPIHAPIRDAMVGGEFLQADDRGGIVIGRRLAEEMGIGLGQDVNLTIINADGQPDEAIFTVRGLFNTDIPSYDQSALFMPLARAQSFAGTSGHASAVIVRLHDQEEAAGVAAALVGPGLEGLTWRDMNAAMLQTVESTSAIYTLLYAIVMAVVAVVVANTLLMAAFERVREMGILAALGMKGRQITLMFLLEATLLGLGGILIGTLLGLLGVYYLATTGFAIGDMGATMDGMSLGSTIHARFDFPTFVALAFWLLVIILLASLYPARFATRQEPAEALRAT
jgi:ABC-type lipoprotein release transport system permease subunit